MEIRNKWLDAIRQHQPRIALADGNDPRTHRASQQLQAWGVENTVLVFDDPHSLIPEGLKVVRAEDALDHAVEMLVQGEVDAVVAGATRTTRDVLRAAVWKIGLAQDASTVSSSFLFELADGRNVTYGDCAVIPEPTVEQLAAIAIFTAKTHEQLTAQQAKVAMLSFSTDGSAEHTSIDAVRAATDLVRTSQPDLLIDGELQFDAAFVPEVAAVKAPKSSVAGEANVFIFPNLAAGNIAYKITERIGGATALGPLLQGLAKPLHDVSRGCSTSDLVDVAIIAGYQAG